MRKVEAVVFDVDGTLLDSREYITGAYLHSLGLHGITGTKVEDIASVIGLPINECYDRLAPGVDVHSLRDAHRDFHDLNPNLLLPYPGAAELLRQLGSRGIRLAVFTSHGPSVIEKLQRFGMDCFDAYIHAESVERHKPHPEGFLKAAAELGASPNRTVMVGDSWVDIEAGRAGGALATIGIRHGFGTAEQLREAGADYIADDLSGVLAVISELEGAYDTAPTHP